MTWNAPRTWVDGETVTASMLNTHLRDNLNALLRPPLAVVRRVGEAASITGNPTVLAPVSSAFSVNVACNGGHLMLWTSGAIILSQSAGHSGKLYLSVDATDAEVFSLPTGIGGLGSVFSAIHVFANISPGVHTCALKWVINNAATSMILRHETPLIFGALEL